MLYIYANLAQDDVPIGKDEKSNKLIHQFGKIKNLFQGKIAYRNWFKIDEIDFDLAAKLSGSRFVILKKIALLERALINYMLDLHAKFNYIEISSSLLMKILCLVLAASKFEDDQFEIKFENSDQENF